jgi:hypothetical protein
VSPVRYELGFISQKIIFFIFTTENLKYYIALTGWALQRRRNVSSVRYELGFYIPEDSSLHSHRRETSNLTLGSIFYIQMLSARH